MMTLKTIKSGDLEVSDIDFDMDDNGYFYLKQGNVAPISTRPDDWIVLTKQSLSELGQYLISLDLD